MNNWSKLYSLADRIYALKPWQFMLEDELIGVRDPVTDTIGFTSVMGNLGEHYAITVYLGESALGQFLQLSNPEIVPSPEMVLEIPQLMVSFEEKEYLDKEDRAVMKASGVSYKGNTLRPVFRSYRPGMVPWFLEERELESMVSFLEQFLEVVVSADAGKWKEKSGSEGQDIFLVRDYKVVGGKISWKNTYKEILIPEPEELSIPIDMDLLNKAKKTPVGKNIFEIDFFLTPAQVEETNQRPYFTYMLLLVDQQSELIISSEVMNPSEGIDNMLSQIPGLLLELFSKRTSLPKAVYTTSLRLAEILFPMLQDFGIQCQIKPRLRSLEMAKSSLMEYFGRS